MNRFAWLVPFALLLIPSRGSAQELGAPGQVVVTGDAYASIATTSYDHSDATFTSVAIGPSAQVFVVRNLSVGVDVEVQYSDSLGYAFDGELVGAKSTLVSGGPIVGYNVPLGGRLSVWPHVTLGVHYTHETSAPRPIPPGDSRSPIRAIATDRFGPWFELTVPLVVQVAPHVFVGVGPRLYHDFARKDVGLEGGERTRIGGDALLGGYWGGEAAEAAPDAAPTRFGDAHQLVLTTEAGVAASYTSYAASPASQSSIAVAPAFDYFPGPGRVSGGLVASFVRTTRQEAPAAFTRTRWSVGPRLGVALPLAAGVSVWPRASLGFGAETTGGPDRRILTLTLDAPLIVELAPHLVLGFGPSLAYDLMHATDDEIVAENRATTLRLALLLGGYL